MGEPRNGFGAGHARVGELDREGWSRLGGGGCGGGADLCWASAMERDG